MTIPTETRNTNTGAIFICIAPVALDLKNDTWMSNYTRQLTVNYFFDIFLWPLKKKKDYTSESSEFIIPVQYSTFFQHIF